MSGNRPLSVAIVGYGLSGRWFHAPLVSAAEGLVLRSVVTADPVRTAQARSDHSGVQVLADVGQLWATAGEHDLVVVATPSGSHVQVARGALEHGLAVVVDKPIALTGPEGRALVDLAAERGLVLAPFHNRRWDSDHLTLLRLLADGRLGTVLRYESRFERWRPELDRSRWRDHLTPAEGGGSLLDLGTHVVDQSLVLFGPVIGVYAELRSQRGGSDDEAFVALHHRSGVRSHLSLGLLFASPGPRLRVLGDRGAFVVSGVDSQEASLRRGRCPGDPGFGEEPAEQWGTLWSGDVDAGAVAGAVHGVPVPSEPGRWIEFYLGLERALRSGAPPPVDPADALDGLAVLDAARRSSSLGEVVTPVVTFEP